MKKFLLKTTIFTIVLIICIVVFWTIICSTRSETLRLPNNENIVFLGNSHIECAVNDSIVKNSFNFARSAENMEYIYCKVKLLKQYNPQLDTIVIGYDNVLLTHSYFKSAMYSPYYYDTYTFNDLKAIFQNCRFEYLEGHFAHPFDWLKIINIIPSFIHSDCNLHILADMGGYLYLFRDKLKEAIKLQGNKHASKISKCDANSSYFLKEIDNFCIQNDITLIFMHTPMHKSLISDVSFYKKYYKENYEHIRFYDFRDMHLPDSCFGDLDHLNYKGAKIFSEYLEKDVFHKQNYNTK